MKPLLTSRFSGLLAAVVALGLAACSPRLAAVETARPTPGPTATPALTDTPSTTVPPTAAPTRAPTTAPTAKASPPGPSAIQGESPPRPAVAPRRLGAWGDGVPVAVALSPDGADLYVASALRLCHHDARDLAQILWDVPLDEPPAALNLSPDGTTLALAIGMRVELRSPADGALVATLRHDSRVADLAFSPDGAALAAVADEALILWDLAGGAPLRKLRMPDSGNPLALPGPLTSVAFAPDGARVAAGDLNGNVAVWPAGGSAPLLMVSVAMRVVADVAFSPDGAALAVASEGWRSEAGAVWLWDASSGDELGRLTIDTETRTLEPVKQVYFTDNGATVVAGTIGGAVLRWSWPTGELQSEFRAHRAAISAMAATAGGGLLTAGRDGDLRRWNADGTRIDELDGLPALSAVAAGKPPLATGSEEGDVALWATGGEDGDVALWAPSGRQVRTFAAHAGQINALAISPDGALLASAGDDGAVRLWSLPDGAARGELGDQAEPILALAFNPAGDRLASAGWDGTVRLWAMPDGAPVAMITAIASDGLSGTAVLGVTFDDHGRSIGATAYDGEVRRFTVGEGAPLPTLESGAGGWLIAVAAASRGGLVALDDSGLLWAWGRDGEPLGRGALADATALAPLSGGRLLTVGPSGGMRLWALAATGPFELAAAASAGDQVAATPDGALVAISSRRGFVELWSIQ